MRKKNKPCLCENLGQMSTEQLEEVLQTELQKENPNEEVVLQILSVLRDRDADCPVEITDDAAAAWEKYKQKTKPGEVKHPARKWIARVAAFAAVVCLLILVVPQDAEADTLFDKIVRFTNNVIQFFEPDSDTESPQEEYVFTTDNPGLEQLYNEVVKQGIVDPVVPMWIPEGYELTELKVAPMPGNTKIIGNFANGTESILITLKMCDETTSSQYEKDDSTFEVYEVGNISHIIIENEDRWSVAWDVKNAECSIVADVEKDDLYHIVDSIYRRNSK